MWRGAPHRILEAARAGQIILYTSPLLLAELEDVLARSKFAERQMRAQVTARELVWGYAALTRLVEPQPIDPVILEDPDDDAVLACAVAAQAEVVVSGDRHLLALDHYRDIPIVSAGDLLNRLSRK